MENERRIHGMVRAAARAPYGVAAVAGERWPERLAALTVTVDGIPMATDK